MGIVKRNRSFLVSAALILVVGAMIFGGVMVARVVAADSPNPAAPLPEPVSYNDVDSYGITGYAPLTVAENADTPAFVADRLKEERGMVLLIYVKGAAADEEMLASFKAVKAQYAADTSFFSFESHEVTETGDLLDQLRVSDPPILAIIQGDGKVAELYTGWIGRKVMEQRIADAVRGY